MFRKGVFTNLLLVVFFTMVFSAVFISTASAWQMKNTELMTQWAADVNPNNPLPEYPRPQMARTQWLNLNGVWQFNPGNLNDPVPHNQNLPRDILVPFPVQSAISGVMGSHERVWYRRMFTVPSDPSWSGKRIMLNFGAVDWQCDVYVNGYNVGTHKGGYDPFSFDITPYLTGTGEQELIVKVYDPTDAGSQPRGKQTSLAVGKLRQWRKFLQCGPCRGCT
ncbi:MAG: hypothetical protein N2645_22230 [Clostridia bacterium]|nr:hypothetical protein [Clostridia bacterium]